MTTTTELGAPVSADDMANLRWCAWEALIDAVDDDHPGGLLDGGLDALLDRVRVVRSLGCQINSPAFLHPRLGDHLRGVLISDLRDLVEWSWTSENDDPEVTALRVEQGERARRGLVVLGVQP